jgi:signal transduction histidine kinase
MVWSRNPLHALAGSAGFIKEASRRGDEIYEDACIVLSNATSMSNLITAIVDWTSATSDASDPVLLPTDVLELCRKAVRSQRVVLSHTFSTYLRLGLG